uniref:Uncharacterized protein n=1 Tax=Ascaris lumbricoides TaxID=6252 RepID=A0A0M3HN87_ASCLU
MTADEMVHLYGVQISWLKITLRKHAVRRSHEAAGGCWLTTSSAEAKERCENMDNGNSYALFACTPQQRTNDCITRTVRQT